MNQKTLDLLELQSTPLGLVVLDFSDALTASSRLGLAVSQRAQLVSVLYFLCPGIAYTVSQDFL